MTVLSKKQLRKLADVWGDLQGERDSAEVPSNDDAVVRAWLDAWLAGVMSSDGRVDESALDDLSDMELAAKGHPLASAYLDRVIRAVMPTGQNEPPWLRDLAIAVEKRCRQRDYEVSDLGHDRFGYRTWEISVSMMAGPVRLSYSGEVFEVNFPGGFAWTEFGYTPSDAQAALQDQLDLVDAYADPGTRVVERKRVLRGSRTELRLSDGTVLWRGGGSRPWK